MKKKLVLPAVSLAVSAMLSGCAPVLFMGGGLELGAAAAQDRGVSGVISDSALASSIRFRFMKHSVDLFSGVAVKVYEGKALLTGTVESESLHQDALRIVRSVGGIKDVIDEITVGSAGVTQAAKDAWITTHLNAVLTFDEDIESINYNVKTENGVVYLTGVAKSSEELKKVTENARNIPGVTKVVSHVRLKKFS
jgi:osmotically-inducible protein OsmY